MITAKTMWVNKNNPSHFGEDKNRKWRNEKELEKRIAELNKRFPDLRHSYKIQDCDEVIKL
jgi:hypothetical protein